MFCGARCLTNSAWGQFVAKEASKFDDVRPPIFGVQVVGRCAEAGVVLNLTSQSECCILYVSASEARVEDDCLDVCVKPHPAVDLCLYVLVEVVESGLVGHAAQVR